MSSPSPAVPERPRQLVRDEAYHAIKTAILTGRILPGERIDDAELQRWLGMSRTPIRQALHALTLEGFVETAPQSYTRVVTPKIEDVAANLQTLGVFAFGITAITLPALTADDRRELVARLAAVIAALSTEDATTVAQSLDDYYAAVTRRCPNRVLAALTEKEMRAHAYSVTVTMRQLGAEVVWSEHAPAYEALSAAIRDGDDLAAERITRELFGI